MCIFSSILCAGNFPPYIRENNNSELTPDVDKKKIIIKARKQGGKNSRNAHNSRAESQEWVNCGLSAFISSSVPSEQTRRVT